METFHGGILLSGVVLDDMVDAMLDEKLEKQKEDGMIVYSSR